MHNPYFIKSAQLSSITPCFPANPLPCPAGDYCQLLSQALLTHILRKLQLKPTKVMDGPSAPPGPYPPGIPYPPSNDQALYPTDNRPGFGATYPAPPPPTSGPSYPQQTRGAPQQMMGYQAQPGG